MRKLCAVWVVWVTWGLAGQASAQEQAGRNPEREARGVIRQGIRAIGGREALQKTKIHTFQENGTFYGMGEGVPYTGEYAVEWPDKFKMEIADAFTIVVAGDQAWVSAGGSVQELTGDQLAEQKQQRHSGYVTSLHFLGQPDYQVKQLADADVDGQAAAVVVVSREGQRDVTLAFDKQSKLLVKAEYKLKSPQHEDREVTEEIWFKDYRDVDGVKVPTKHVIHRDGQKFVEGEISDYTFPQKLDPGVFARPE
jgi:hypothetical protein